MTDEQAKKPERVAETVLPPLPEVDRSNSGEASVDLSKMSAGRACRSIAPA